MELKEFALKLGQAELVRQKRSRIQDAFCVRVDFTSQAEAAARTGLEWIAVSGISASDCDNAREYIMAVACPESQICLPIPEWFACELQRDNQFLCKSLEKQSKAALTFLSSKELHVRGSRQSVDLGMTLVLSQLAKLSSNAVQNMPRPHTESNAGHASLVDSGTRDFLQKIGYSNADITCAAMKLASLSQEINADTLMGLLVLLVRSNKSEEVLSQHAEVASLTEGNLSRPVRTIAEASATQAKALVSPANSEKGTSTLRDIVIDGSNIALCHGCKKVFSCRGIQIVVDWFKKRGHQNIIAFVPEWRKEASKPESPIDKQEILLQLEQEGHLVFTPSRRLMDGRRVTPYDDRYILKYAASLDSIVVSNDNYRDLQKENPDWKNIVEKRLLMYSFVGDMFMPPDDPLGRHGPNLDEFLMKGSLPSKTCPYRNKCTYGAKCRFYHPEKSGEVTDTDALDQRKSSNSASSSSGFDNAAHAVQEERHSKQDARRPVLSCAVEMRRLNLSDSTQCLDNEIRAKGPTRNVRSANSPFLESPGLFSGPGGISPHGSQFLDARGDREAMFAPGVSYKQELHGAGQPVYSVSHSDYYPSPGYPPWTTYPGYPNPDGRGSNAYLMSPHHQHGVPSPYATPQVLPAPSMRPGERLYNNQMGYGFDSVTQRSQQHMQTPVMMTNAPQIQSFNVVPGSHHSLRSSAAEPLSLYYQLVEMFPGNEAVVRRVLLENQNEADANVLVSCILRSIST